MLGVPCHGELTHPAITASITTARRRSTGFIGPSSASASRAWVRAGAVSARVGGTRRRIRSGTSASVRSPGTIAPASQRTQVSSTPPIFRANSAISGFAAMPVRNIPDAV